MGKVHELVNSMCGEYFQKLRRNVYVTPKSYLSFIDAYQALYEKKYDLIDVDEKNIVKGLDALAEAAKGVEELKIDLKKEEVKLKEASDVTDKLLKELDVETKKADAKGKEVDAVTEACYKQRDEI